jgi:hypothetical protein
VEVAAGTVVTEVIEDAEVELTEGSVAQGINPGHCSKETRT